MKKLLFATLLVLALLAAACGGPATETTAPPQSTSGAEESLGGDDTVTDPQPVSLPSPTPIPVPSLAPLPQGISANACPNTLPSMLMPGRQGRVSNATPDPNRVRSAPSQSGEIVGQIPAGAYFDVLEGPTCADDAAWFKVRYEKLEGWMKEGSASEYWVMSTQQDARLLSGADIQLPGMRFALPPEFGTTVEVQDLTFDPATGRLPVTTVRLTGYPFFDFMPGIYVYPVVDQMYYKPERRSLFEEVRAAINAALKDPKAKITLPNLRQAFPADKTHLVQAGPFGEGYGLHAIVLAGEGEPQPYYIFYGFSGDMQYLTYARLPVRLIFGELAFATLDDFQPDIPVIDSMLGLRARSETVIVDAAAAGACPGAPPFTLSLSDWARVSVEPPLPSRLRDRPGSGGAVVGQAQPGENVLVIDGPKCANGYTWWKVRSVDGLEGWAIEGDKESYWLVEPISPWTSLPASIPPGTPKIIDLRELSITPDRALISGLAESQLFYLAVPPDYNSGAQMPRSKMLSAYSTYTFNSAFEIFEFNVIDIQTPDSRYYLGGDYLAKLQKMINSGEVLQTELEPFTGSAYYGAPRAFIADAKILTFTSGKGIRYLFVSKNAAPAYNPLIYYFQGISDDGRYYIYAALGVSSEYLITSGMLSLLEGGFGPFAGYTPGDYAAADKSYDTYNERIETLLEAHLLTLYPSLDLLDAMFASIEIKPDPVSWEIPPGVCRDNWSRLVPGGKATVIAPFEEGRKVFDTPRPGSATSQRLKQGDILEILDGPNCIEGLVFWRVKQKVDSAWVEFWVAEGDRSVYWLEPYKEPTP